VVYASSSSALATGSALTFSGTDLTLNPGTGSGASSFLYVGAADTTGTAGIRFIRSSTGVQMGKIDYNFSTNAMLFRTNGNDRMTLDASGNLGLGVTPSGNSGNGNSIQISYAGTIHADAGNPNTSIASSAYRFDNDWKYKNGSFAPTLYTQGSGIHTWFTAPIGTSGNTISFTQAMTLNGSGRLGVATTDPRAVVHIGAGLGGGNVPTTSQLMFGANNSIVTFLGANDSDSIDGVIGSWNTVYNHQNAKIEFFKSANTGSLRFYTQAGVGITERLRIAESGAFGLSGANYGSSGQVLTSGGSGAAPTWTTVSGGGGSPGGSDTQIQYNNSGAFGGSAIFTFNKSTTAPVVTLGGASGVTSTVLQLRAPSATNGPYVGFSLGNADAALFWTHDSVGNFPFRFVAAGNEFARFDASGKFGIGTSNPTSLLHTSGALCVGGTGGSGTNGTVTLTKINNGTFDVTMGISGGNDPGIVEITAVQNDYSGASFGFLKAYYYVSMATVLTPAASSTATGTTFTVTFTNLSSNTYRVTVSPSRQQMSVSVTVLGARNIT
jgi:hypothetical protein